MPLLRYFGWVGSLLLAALVVTNWCMSKPGAPASDADIPLNQKINIRIHTDKKWPERVVFDTTRSTLAPEGISIGPGEAATQAERQPLDAFAQIPATAARPCFRPPCAAGRPPEPEVSSPEKRAPIQQHARLSTVVRNSVSVPSRLHKPPGKS
jgi:hypothetical protein